MTNFLISSLLLPSCFNGEPLTPGDNGTESLGVTGGQIVADHTIVERFDDIPEYYLEEVKRMWLAVPGESHALGYMKGLVALESSYPDNDVSYTYRGNPEGYTTSHLRASISTWGDLNNENGWIYSYGEEDWFTSEMAINRTKAGITYCHDNDLEISALGFGWCYDGGYTDMTDYLKATQEYIDHCNVNGYNTKVFFTTGPVDSWNAKGEGGYLKYLAYEAIRNYVDEDSTRILFDYADILCYDDNSTEPNMTSWNGNEYPIITEKNGTPESVGHISVEGQVRLAKAMWWMLARMAGWDGD
ncbi:MAG: hypothetical protein RQ743_11980 [Bacteroidales bacterium]|nr:hypothetical protein [Bacteroidales bacterium]